MKRVFRYLPILLVFWGCDSFLDRESYDKMDSDGFYNSTTALNSAVIACYNGIQGDGCGHCPACTLRREGLEKYLASKV